MSWVYIAVEKIERVTDKAFLVRTEQGEKHWIPYSHVSPEDRDDYEEGDIDLEMPVTEWLAKEKGLG